MKLWLASLILVAVFPVAAQSTESESLVPFHESAGHCGYKDSSGRVEIKPRFGMCSNFSEGVARVRERGSLWGLQSFLDIDKSPTSWGFIDASGKYVLKFKPDEYREAGSFSDALAPIFQVKTKKYGYIDHSGKLAIAPQFDYAREFSDGLAVVCSGDFHPPGQGFYLTQKEIAKMASQLCGFIDHAGHLVSPYRWKRLEDFHEGYAIFQDGGKFGYLDKNGSVAVPATLRSASRFSEGLAAVAKEELFGYIEPSGQFVIAPQFIAAEPFSDGLAAVARERLDHKFGKTENVKSAYLDSTPVFGYIDKQGTMVISPQFLSAGEFYRGNAYVEVPKVVQFAGPDLPLLVTGRAKLNRDGTFADQPVFPQMVPGASPTPTPRLTGTPPPLAHPTPARNGPA